MTASDASTLDGITRRATQLQEVTAALSRALTAEDAASAVAAHGRALAGSTATAVYVLEGGALRLAAQDGLPDDRAAAYARLPLDAPAPVALAARTHEALWLEDREALLRAFPALAGIRIGDAELHAIVALPVHDSQDVIAVIGLSFYGPQSFDAVHREFLLTVASQLGQAMERARLFEAERAARGRLEHQKKMLSVLAKAGETLASALTSKSALAELARLVVPTLADWCSIEELTPDGELRRVTVQHTDPQKVALAHALFERYPVDLRAESGLPNVLRTGATEWAAHVPDEVLVASAADEAHLASLRSLGMISYACVPLAGRAGILGALTLVQAESGRRFTPDDVELAEDLARRAALALENARLHEAAEATRVKLHALLAEEVRGRHQIEALVEDATRSEARLRALVAATAAIVWTATADGQVVEISPSWLTFTGQTEDEYLNGGFLDAIHPDDRAPTMARWTEAVRARAPYAAEYRLRRRDGAYAYTLARGMPVFDAGGAVREYVGCNVEITDLRRAEAAAREHAGNLTTMNELGRLISAELDLRKVVQAVTDAATSLTGAEFGAFFYNVIDDGGARYMLYSLSGAPIEAFAQFPMPRNTEVFAPTFGGHGVVRLDDVTKDPRYGKNPPYDGMPRGHLPVRSYLAVPVISRSSEVLGGVFLGHSRPGVFDAQAEALAVGLTAQAAVAMDNARLFEEAQRLIRALERSNADLDQFAYVTSHDLKAPLRGIGSLSEWLEEDLGDALNDEARRKLDLLRGRVRRMEGLIQGILDYSRAGRPGGKREDVDLKGLLDDVIDVLAPAPPASVAVEGYMPSLVTERVALEQVLMNLIGNALKHAGRPDAEARVEVRDAGDKIEIRVTDNGPGIAPEFHERIWGIFQTLQARDKLESTGIGLAIVKKIVASRGGRISVESEEGRGATFVFTWPKRDERRA